MEENRDMEEISLRQLIETLLKGKKIIAGLLVVAIVLSFLGSMIIKDKSQTAKIVIALNFEGIEEGVNPDGTKFDIQKMQSPKVIMDALNSLEHEEIKFSTDDVRRNIIVEPIIPNHIVTYIQEQRKEGKDFTYFPNEFTVSLKTNKSVGLDAATSKKILDAIINSYADYFNSIYSEEEVLANAIGDINYDEYDYPEISSVANNQISIFKSYLTGRIDEAPDFRSSTTGMTFLDILKSLEFVESVELNRMDSLIGAFNLTKDMQKLIINYEYMIKQLELQRNKKESELSVSKDMMVSYQRENNTLLLPSMGTEGFEAGSNNDYYDKLVERATNAGVDANNKGHDINYYLNEIDKLKNDTVDRFVKKNAEDDVLSLANTIKDKLIYWIEVVNKTASEYYDVKFSQAIMKISPVEIYSNTNTMMNVAIASVLSIMVGVFYVFFKEYWNSTMPK